MRSNPWSASLSFSLPSPTQHHHVRFHLLPFFSNSIQGQGRRWSSSFKAYQKSQGRDGQTKSKAQSSPSSSSSSCEKSRPALAQEEGRSSKGQVTRQTSFFLRGDARKRIFSEDEEDFDEEEGGGGQISADVQVRSTFSSPSSSHPQS